jgi:serine/threonine protein kinase
MLGRILGHFLILQKIGSGGMGEVYRARDAQLDRLVALKVLLPGSLSTESARRRFRQEAMVLAKLNHPNIEIIYEFGSQDELDFLAMELIDGQPLHEKLKEALLPEEEILRLGIQITDGLAAAHEQKIIHRDLKPANLMITPKGQVKILDFGLATLLRPPDVPESTAGTTARYGIPGTLPYMSPEQLKGMADQRSDVYAAGVILFEMATGSKPFPQKLETELIGAILYETPARPRSVNPRVTPALESVILRALEKEPSQRYQSARELGVALDSVRSGRLAPTTATVPAMKQEKTNGLPFQVRPGRKKKVWPYISAGVVAIFLAAFAVTLYLRSRPPGPQSNSGPQRLAPPAQTPAPPSADEESGPQAPQPSVSIPKRTAPPSEGAATSSPTLRLFAPHVDPGTGVVTLNGVDSAHPTAPFLFEWGDGTSTSGFFPQSKTYQSGNRTYTIRVTAEHADGSHQAVVTTVDIPALSAALGSPIVRSVSIRLPGGQPWTDTGLDLAEGQTVRLSASGTIVFSRTDPRPEGPNGSGVACYQNGNTFAVPFVAGDLPCHSLLGRIGSSGRIFEIGAERQFRAAGSGRLYLGINDNFFPDNTGSWTAEVTVGAAMKVVRSEQECVSSGDAHGTVKIVSGTGSFASVGKTSKVLPVAGGTALSGSVTLQVLNTGPGFAVAPLIQTPSWGQHQSSWTLIGNLRTGESTVIAPVNYQVPPQPGIYYIFFAYELETNGGSVASGTNWALGRNQWNSGHDLADFSASQVLQAQQFGCAVANWVAENGAELVYVPVDAITLEVGVRSGR